MKNYVKSLQKALVFLLSTVLLFSCNQIETFEAPDLSEAQARIPVQFKPVNFNARVEAGYTACGTPETHKLMAGQNIPVGEVTVFNDNEKFYVTVSIEKGEGFDDGDWFITKIHAWFGEVEADFEAKGKKGIRNPAPGKFPINESIELDYGIADQVYTYELEVTPELIAHGEFDVAVHAEVVRVEGLDFDPLEQVWTAEVAQTEGAWAGDEQFNPNGQGNWALYMAYTIQDCTVECDADWSRTITVSANGEYVAIPGDQLTITYTINGATGPVGYVTVNRSGNAGSPDYRIRIYPLEDFDFNDLGVCVTDSYGNNGVCVTEIGDFSYNATDGFYQVQFNNAPKTVDATNPGNGNATKSTSKISINVVSNACDAYN